jgi:hypothetical protein
MSLACRLLFASTLSLVAIRAQDPSEPLISHKQFLANIVHDQKPIFTFPAKLAKGKHWKPFTAVAIGTAGFVLLDPHLEPYFHDKGHFDNAKTGPLRGRNTTLAITMTPVAFYLTSLVTHDPYTRNTALLAAEGIVDTQVLNLVTKSAIGRLKPSDIPLNGNYRDTWFKYKGQWYNRGGFPSGHTASAFAVATVISGRYSKHRWVPFVAYGAAAVLSLSRLPAQAHFPSDIFIGGALGYGIGRLTLSRH